MLYALDLTFLDAALLLDVPRRVSCFTILDQLTSAGPPADFARFPKSIATAARHLYVGDPNAQLFAAFAARPGFSEPAFADMRDVLSRCPDIVDNYSMDPGPHLPVIAQALHDNAVLVTDEVSDLADRISTVSACNILNISTITSSQFFQAFSI